MAFKVRTLFGNDPSSKANIATIRSKKGYITIGPYKNNDDNSVECWSKKDIAEKLINDIKEISCEIYSIPLMKLNPEGGIAKILYEGVRIERRLF